MMPTLLNDTQVNAARTSRWSRVPDAVETEIDGELVLMSATAGTYAFLNPTASSVWHALDTVRSLDDIVDALSRRYALPPQAPHTRVLEFLVELESQGLIARESASLRNHDRDET